MYSNAALMLANAHITDLVAEADRERLATLARQTRRPQTRLAAVDWLRVSARRVVRVVRELRERRPAEPATRRA